MIGMGSGAILCIQCKGSVHVYAMLVTGTGILRRLCFHIWTNTGCIDCLSTLMLTMMSPKALHYYNLQAKFAGRRAAQHCCHEKGKEERKQTCTLILTNNLNNNSLYLGIHCINHLHKRKRFGFGFGFGRANILGKKTKNIRKLEALNSM
jgi:hypothetical protein